MDYIISINNKKYNLPKRTLSIDSQIEQFKDISQIYESNQKTKEEIIIMQYEFILNVLGENNANEIFGSDDINDIDINFIFEILIKIINIYNDPIMKIEFEQKTKEMNAIVENKNFQKAVNLIQNVNKSI